MKAATALSWAREEFGRAALGDIRRTRRLVQMAAGAALNPSGKVSAVFDRAKEREGAYDFLESSQASAKTVAEGVFSATAERARKEPYVYVVIDGSSLSLPDETGRKGFGPVGTRHVPVSGVMVTSALAVAGDGTPLGLINRIYWSRSKTLDLSKYQVWQRNRSVPFEDKEPAHFVRAARTPSSVCPKVSTPGSSSTAKRTTATSCSRCRARTAFLRCARATTASSPPRKGAPFAWSWGDNLSSGAMRSSSAEQVADPHDEPSLRCAPNGWSCSFERV